MVSRLKSIVVLVCLLVSPFSFALTEKDKVEFQKKQLTLTQGKRIKKISVEIAETEKQHEYGLMFRRSLPNDHGMLFVFKDEMVRSFWMKNTLIDLSIGYFNKSKQLIDVQEMKAMSSVMQTNFQSYPSRGPAQYALEMPARWFTQNEISEGAIFNLK